MTGSTTWQSSYFLEDRNKPLNPATSTSLNDALQTEHLDVPEEDDSLLAHLTRSISKIVGALLSPRQVLSLLRVLKAVTLSFLVLTILSDLMYIIFVEVLSSSEVHLMAGGQRDIIIRVYGLGLACIGLAIELDYSKVVKKFTGLKGFIPRSVLYFFIMQITGSHPILIDYHNNGNSGNDENEAANDDDTYASVEVAIPSSAVGFQRVTSFVLGICSLGYLFCGLLCFDRFTARAFLSNKDPRVTTAIPTPETGKHSGGDTNNASGSTSVQTYSVTSSTIRDASTVGNNPDPPGW